MSNPAGLNHRHDSTYGKFETCDFKHAPPANVSSPALPNPGAETQPDGEGEQPLLTVLYCSLHIPENTENGQWKHNTDAAQLGVTLSEQRRQELPSTGSKAYNGNNY